MTFWIKRNYPLKLFFFLISFMPACKQYGLDPFPTALFLTALFPTALFLTALFPTALFLTALFPTALFLTLYSCAAAP